MLFTSLEFILMFLPIVMAGAYLLPVRARNAWLLLASLFFYAWGEPLFVLVMLFSILFNYLAALGIGRKAGKNKACKALLALDLTVNLGLLFVFKYLGFALDNLKAGFPSLFGQITVPPIRLPLGISFFTFQAISYVIDVYRGTPARRNPLELGLYISLFPQLIAGPIVRYTEVSRQIAERKMTMAAFSRGVLRFLRGFSKKVLLANILSRTADPAFGAGGNSVCMAWLGAVCYALQLYFDFSGYSDMAIGMGAMLGFEFPENFDDPYLSATVTEFWRRWHMSLGRWFRDYVYIPLGGSRVGRARLSFNLMCVWLLTGLWHGANWTFVLWGGLFGLLVLLEKQAGIPQRIGRAAPAARGIYRGLTLLAVLTGWVIFRSDTLSGAGAYLADMFGLSGNAFAEEAFLFHLREAGVFLAAGILCAAAVPGRIKRRLESAGGTPLIVGTCVGDLLLVLLFVIAVTFLVMNAHDPFIYFNF